MIVVTIQLWPGGNRHDASELGRMYIANDGTGTHEHGNYQVAVCKKGAQAVPFPMNPSLSGKRATRYGRVESYPRERLPIWHLMLRAIKAAFPEAKDITKPGLRMPKPKCAECGTKRSCFNCAPMVPDDGVNQ